MLRGRVEASEREERGNCLHNSAAFLTLSDKLSGSRKEETNGEGLLNSITVSDGSTILLQKRRCFDLRRLPRPLRNL